MRARDGADLFQTIYSASNLLPSLFLEYFFYLLLTLQVLTFDSFLKIKVTGVSTLPVGIKVTYHLYSLLWVTRQDSVFPQCGWRFV